VASIKRGLQALRGKMQTRNYEGMIKHKGEKKPSSYQVEMTVSHSMA